MKNWLQYVIISSISLLIALCVLFVQNSFEHSGTLLLSELSNAFFVPGVLTLGVGVLIWCSNEGALDMLSYGIKKLFDLFKRDLTKVKYRTFYEYKNAQKEKRYSFSAYIIVGAVMIVISAIFLIIYHNY